MALQLVDCILCCLFTLLLQSAGMRLAEGATQNFSIAGLDSLSPNRLPLTAYGGMQAYVAYMPDSIDSQKPSAWLLFIPAVPSSNSSFILASLVFKQASQNQMGAIVWMPNRDHPVSRNFSLSLDQTSGNLILLDGDGSLAWSSNVSYVPNGTVSMDLNTSPSGNNVPIGTLLLSDSANTTFWRSSDYPTHTLASLQFFQPGMSLVSWASTSDPSDGLYRLVMEAGGIALYYDGYSGSPLPYWLWSYYGRNDSFGVTHICKNLTQAFMDPEGGLLLQLSNETPQQGLTSSDLCAAADSNGAVAGLGEAQFSNYGAIGNDDITILSVQYDGNLLAYSVGSPWTTIYDLFGDDKCLLPNYCGPYGICSAPSNCECPSSTDGSFPSTFPSDHAQGCPPTRTLSCKDNNASLDTTGQQLLRFEGVDYFPNKYSASLNLTSQDACQDACLQNCSCLVAFWHDHSKSCFHASQFVSSLQRSLNSSYIAFLKVEAVAENSSNQRRLVIGLVSGAVALLFVVVLVAALFMYYRKVYKVDDDADAEEALWSHIPGLPRRFSYKELQIITNNFSEQLGKGGFGAVYAGALQDGTKVAVKQLESLRQGAKEFRAEVVILGGVHHYNLVELVGFCAEGRSHRLLVYEYMANGSVDQWLFAAKDQQKPNDPLPWKHRFNIALGAAKGLAYLHEGCKDTVVHLDIKPQNILLDDNFVAKVADFGLSTLIGRDETHLITTMRGTPGYLAPEWLAEGSEISSKCDVFSYGKLLMELLGARKNLDPSLVEEQEELFFPARLYLRTTHEGGAADADLKYIAGVETSEEMVQAKMMMKTAFLCVLENPSQRPSMETVVHMLEGRIPMLEQLNLSDLFHGLHFALRMPSSSLANDRIEKALAFILESSTSLSEYAESCNMSRGGAGQPYSCNVSAR